MTNNEINSIEERLSRMERTLEKISEGLQQAPVMLSIATDSVDEILRESKSKGISTEDRIKSGLHLLSRLSDPKINSALNGLLDTIEQAPGLISMLADTVDETIVNSNNGSVRLDDRIKAVTTVVSQLSDPATVEKLMQLMKLGDQLPGLMAMTMDSVDDFMHQHGKEFIDSLSFLDKDNLLFLKQAGDAFEEAKNEPSAPVGGIFAIMRAMKDPGRQKALGFLMNVLKNLGNKI